MWGEDSRPGETPATKSPPSRSESQTDSGLDVQSDSLLSPSLEQYDHEEGWRQSQIQVGTEGWRQSPILEASTEQVVTAAPPSPRRQQSVELRGSSDENAIPEVRVESDIDLPSVKNLMSRFSHSESNLNPDGTSVKRVSDLNLNHFDQEWDNLILQCTLDSNGFLNNSSDHCLHNTANSFQY